MHNGSAMLQRVDPNNSMNVTYTGRQRWAVLAIIVLLNLGGSIHWVLRNTVLVGHDSTSYLATSMEYARFFTDFSLPTLFKAFTYTDYRTPALFIAVQPFYWLGGVNMDSAQWINVLTLGLLIWWTYALGKQVAGVGVGLFSAALVGLLPMVAAMARLFYTELPLTALVVLTLLALAKSNGWHERRWSVIWGLALGVGLLVKWALPLYILLPVLWAIWQAGLVSEHAKGWRTWRLNARAVLSASLGSLLLILVWCWPNLTALQQFPLGNGLLIGWFLVLLLWLYSLLQPSSPVSNWWAGVLTAATIASLWYLPRIDFISKVIGADQTRGDAGATPLNFYNYRRYFEFLYDYHLGALLTWLLIPMGLLPWLWALIQRKPLPFKSALLWLSLASTYLILLLLAQSSPRFFLPVIPSLLILLVIGLWQYPRWLRLLLGASWLTAALLQWGVFTFDGLNPLYARSESLWAFRYYATPPASYETDPAYWIGPAVLDQVQTAGEGQRLAMLVNSDQVHRGLLKYIMSVEGRPLVEIKDLTENSSRGWYDLLSAQWLLSKDGDNRNVEAGGLALIERLRTGDPLFQALYQPVQDYPLPNGETVTLYHRTRGPGRPHDLPLQLEQTAVVAEAIRQAWSKHATLVYANADEAVWVGIHDPAAAPVQLLGENPAADLAALAQLRGTLLIVWDHQAGALQSWLDEHAYRTYEVGDDFAAVAIYGMPIQALQPLAAKAAWSNLTLVRLQSYPTVRPGEVLPLRIEWNGSVPEPVKLSLRLLSPDGTVLASHDRPVLPSDHLGLFVPPQTPAGVYMLAAVLYDASTLTNLPDLTGNQAPVLTTIQVTQE